MRICVTIKSETTAQAVEDMMRADEADLIELRLDYRREQLDLGALRAATQKPLIATNRRRDQGGATLEAEEGRIGLLLEAVEAGFDIVDISSQTERLAAQVKRIQGSGAKVIASYHDFKEALTAQATLPLPWVKKAYPLEY